MDEPKFRKKHLASEKKKDKGPVYATKRHVRIELVNLQRHEKNLRCKMNAGGGSGSSSP